MEPLLEDFNFAFCPFFFCLFRHNVYQVHEKTADVPKRRTSRSNSTEIQHCSNMLNGRPVLYV